MLRDFNLDTLNKPIFWYVAISLFVLLIYAPSLNGEFLYWDDVQNISENPSLIAGNFKDFFAQPYLGMYIPIAYSAWTVIFKLFGNDTAAFHFLSLFLHINNTFFLYLISKKLIPRPNTFWTMAGVLLFAIHPLQIETVAWISGGRDLMAAFFAITSVYALLSQNIIINSIASPLLFFIGLLCKISIAPLPFVILVLRLLIYRKIEPKHIVAFAISIILLIPLVIITFSTQKDFYVLSSHINITDRFAIAIDSIGFYISKLIFPIPLSADYGRTPKFILENLWKHPQYLFIAIASVLAFIFLRFNKIFFIAAFIFISFLFPVLGFLNFVYQSISTVADRYMYLPIFGISYGIMLYGAKDEPERVKNYVMKTFFVTYIILLLAMSMQRVRVWESDYTFFTDMLIKNPLSYSAHQNLGRYYFDANKQDLATDHFESAYSLAPNIFTNFASYYIMKDRLGDYDEVVNLTSLAFKSTLERGKRLQPITWANLMNSLASSLYAKEKYQLAFDYLCEVLDVYPDHSLTLQNLENLKLTMNKEHTTYKCK